METEGKRMLKAAERLLEQKKRGDRIYHSLAGIQTIVPLKRQGNQKLMSRNF